MIKVYVDWGVMSQMKRGQYPQLSAILSRKYQFWVIYSTSHISDLLVSYNETNEQILRIKSDLTFISKITGNFCAFNENKKIIIMQRDPQELFNERLDQQKEYGDGGPLSAVLNSLEPESEAYTLLKQYMDSPLPEAFLRIFNDPVNGARIKEHYPGLEGNPTIGNLVNIGWNNNRKLIETEEHSKLRKTYQDALGINKDKVFEQQDPFKLINKLGTKTGYNLVEPNYNDNSPEWFQDISHNYQILDLTGYQQDTIKVDGRNKKTMRNTIDDGFHSAFASMCDFYITSDRKAFRKTKEVYKKLCINTKVLSPVEFETYFETYLNYQNPQEHLLQWFSILKSKEYTVIQNENDAQLAFHLNHFLFDYFNRLYIVIVNGNIAPTILLTKDKPTNNKFIYRNELSELINKLSFAFDAVIGSERFLEQDDISFENWQDYNWEVDNYTYRLVFRENYLHLYMDVSKVWNEALVN